MPPTKSKQRIPAYRLHKATGLAVVTLAGRDHYCGPHGTPESKAEYDRLVAEWLARGRTVSPNAATISINELCLAYLEHARAYYVKNGKQTSEVHLIQTAIRSIRPLYGMQPVTAFRPLAFKAVRDAMIAKGWARTTVNSVGARIKRMFRWGVESELVPADVYHGLQAVTELRKGRSKAREPGRVKPVPRVDLDAARPFLGKMVRAMVDLAIVTGMRPGEICILRGRDVDMSGPVWVYTPATFKTEHHEDDARTVLIGPDGQDVLRPWLVADRDAYVFDPRRSESERSAERRRLRVTPMTPSQQKRKPKARRKRPPADRYTNESFRRAIHRACERADAKMRREPEKVGEEVPDGPLVPKWSPNRLRHNFATYIRRKYGLEAAQVLLGHKRADVTQIYAERNLERALKIIAEAG
jgi:integrase